MAEQSASFGKLGGVRQPDSRAGVARRYPPASVTFSLRKGTIDRLSTTVYTIVHIMSAKSTRPKRHSCPINVLVRPDQKQRLDSEVNRTNVNQSAMVRKALDILFEQMDKGQLKLGFSELGQGVQ